jgi:hypothetical protein
VRVASRASPRQSSGLTHVRVTHVIVRPGRVQGYSEPMPGTRSQSEWVQHAPHNAMDNPGEIERFYDCCSVLMRQLLDALAAAPDQPRCFPEIEDSIGWPRRRIASVLGGVWHLRTTEFSGRRPYRFIDEHDSASRRWEMWMDASQALAVRAASRR